MPVGDDVRDLGHDMTVRLMLTCLCDAFYGEVGIATVRVLEAAGCRVEFPPEQTCCGQPPFNAGDWDAARKLVLRAAEVFAGEIPVVTPSASCAAMVRHGATMLMRDPPFPCYELAEFLVDVVGIPKWKRGLPRRRVAFHQSCHGRALRASSKTGSGPAQRLLLESINGLEVIDLPEPEQCCGFGGAFSSTHGSISAGIGMRKLEMAMQAGATEIVGGDMGCLMHLDGLIRREALPLKVRHFAQVLDEALR